MRRGINLVRILATTFGVLVSSPVEAQQTIVVTPKEKSEAYARPSDDRNAFVFRVRNEGSSEITVQLSCKGTGAVLACRVDEEVTVPAGRWLRVPVRYRSGASGSGTLELTATGSDAFDDARIDVLVKQPPPDPGLTQGWFGTGPSSALDLTQMVGAGSGFLLGGATRSERGVYIFISPWGGTFSGPVDVAVDWCAEAMLDPSTRELTLGKTDVTGDFSYVPLSPECAYTAQSLGTITLTSSSSTFTAYICDKFNCASESAVFYKPVSDRPTVSAALNPGPMLDRSACVTADAGPSGAFQCGELLLTHSMPSYRSKDRDRSLTLVYNSATASPRPVVMADIEVAAGVLVPDSILAVLTVDGTTRGQWWLSKQGFMAGGQTRRVSLPFSAAAMPTGVYPYTVEIISYSTTYPQPRTSSASGDLVIVNRSASPYGAGWSVAGVEQIYSQSGGSRMLLVQADGSYALYDQIQGTSNKWLAPAGAYRDTLVYGGSADPASATNRYWRRLLDGTRIYYSPEGRHLWTVDKIDNVRYTYRSTTSVRAGLSEIRITPYAENLLYTFSYTGSGVESEFLTQVSDPAGRQMQLTMSGTRLVAARDPLPSQNPAYSGGPSFTATGPDSVRFGYNPAEPLLTTWTSRRGYSTTYEYRPGTALLTKATAPASVQWTYTPTKTVGLVAGSTPLNVTVPRIDVLTSVKAPNGALPGTFRFRTNRYGAPTEVINPRGAMTFLSYSSSAPLLVSRVQHPNGRKLGMYYDGRARLFQADDSTHSAGLNSTRIEYTQANAPHLPSKIVTPRHGALKDSVRYTYNTLGLTQAVVDTRGNTTSFAYYTTAGARNRGQVHTITDASGITTFTYDPDRANLLTVTVPSTLRPAGFTTTYETDAAGRVRKILTPGSQASQYVALDVMNHARGIKVSDSITVVSGGSYQTVWRDTIVTRFYPDKDGNDTLRIDPKGSRRFWTRDGLGRVTSARDEFGISDTYGYYGTELGVLTRRNGTQVQRWLDAFGRDSITYITTGPAHPNYETDTIRHTYDTMGNSTVIENRHAKILRQYTKEGAISRDELIDKQFPGSSVFNYTYALSGARKTMATGGNTQVVYEYGPDNLLTDLKYTTTSYPQQTIRLFHDALGRRDSINFMGGMGVGYSYDASGVLTHVKWHPSRHYTVNALDPAGRIELSTLYSSAGLQSSGFTYDNRGQVISDMGGRYGYDEAGNRLIRRIPNDTTKYTFATGTGGMRTDRLIRAIRKQGSLTSYQDYSYDASGWMTRDSSSAGRWPHVYTAAGQLRTHNILTDTANQYRHDGLGRMISRRVPSGTARLAYDGHNVASVDGLEFLHGPGLDDPLAAVASQAICLFVTAGGRALDIVSYTYGVEITCPSESVAYAGAIRNSFNFALMRDGEATPSGATQLQYFRNRWYDSSTGRFTQEDPIGFAGGSNLYAYSGNNPASYTDPFGLCPPLWKCLADLGAGFTPGVSTVHDATTLATGRNVVTGESVGAGGRLVALAGLATPASGPLLQSLGRIGSKLANQLSHLDRRHLSIAARELRGLETGWDHVTEVREAAAGLRSTIQRLNGILGNPNLDDASRRAATEMLSRASRSLDAAEAALRQ